MEFEQTNRELATQQVEVQHYSMISSGIDESIIRDSSRPDRLVLTGVHIILSSDRISPERDLIVRAETIEIVESLNLPGCSVHLFARQILCAGEVVIDVSGQVGSTTPGKAKNGRNPGDAGSHGKDGGPGQHSGNIKILAGQLEGKLTLLARGGRGGKGQDGGDGAKGARGTDGKTGERNWSYKFKLDFQQRANAGTGKQGGRAGRAGKAGKGGNGGQIIVAIKSGLEEEQLVVDTTAGLSGLLAKRGKSGRGGDAGNVGWYYWHTNRSSPGKPVFGWPSPPPIKWPGNPAFWGQTGIQAPKPESNSPGTPGTAQMQQEDHLNDDSFGEQITPILGRLLLREAFMDHLNGNYENAARCLIWILKLLEPDTPRAVDHAALIDADAPGEEIVPDYEFDGLRQQAALQLRRLELGFDAYGNPPSFIPMVTYGAYRAYTERWLDSARRAEEIYAVYADKNQAQELRMKNLKDAIENLDLLAANLEQNLQENSRSSDQIQDDIAKDLDAVQKAGGALMLAANEFKDAVKRHTSCDLVDVLKAAGSIVSMGSNLWGNLNNIYDAVTKVIDGDEEKEKAKDEDKKKEEGDKKEDDKQKKGKNDSLEFLSLLSKQSKVVAGEVKDVVKAYGELEKLLDDGPEPYIPSDEAKIVAEKEKVEKSIEEFKSLPEAGAYQEAIDKYMNLVQARNKKILEHDAMILLGGELQNAIDQAKKDAVNLKTNLATSTDPDLPQFVEFMQRTLDVYKTELIRSLYYAQRALAYLTLTEPTATFQRDRVVQLEHTFRLLDQSLLRATEERGRDHQLLELGHRLPKVSLKSLLEEEEMARLRNREAVDFIIPDYYFADFYHVFVTKVRPIFQGLPDDVAPAIRLVHTGNARFYSREGLIREFTHAARVTFAFQDDADGASFGQSEEFISLSPFGPWRADLALSGANRNISFENLEDIFLEFELKYLPRSF